MFGACNGIRDCDSGRSFENQAHSSSPYLQPKSGLLQAHPTMNHYETLGVDKNATAEEIKTAYRRKASEHHPDKSGSEDADREIMQAVNEAYRILSDEKLKADYDMTDEQRIAALVEQSVKQTVRQALNEAIVSGFGDPVDAARKILQVILAAKNQEQSSMLMTKSNLEGRMGKIRRKGVVDFDSENYIKLAVDQVQSNLVALEGVVKVLTLSIQELTDYSFDRMAPASPFQAPVQPEVTTAYINGMQV
jgi:curved DNA-binding protein CbpA